MMGNQRAIIIFDGVCYLCSGFVDFVLKRDSSHKFLFGANQTQKARELLKDAGVLHTDYETVYLISGGQVFQKSEAVLRILKHLSFPWPLFYVLIIIPPCVRDAVYCFIAKRRYQWFGKRTQCRLLNAQEQERFIL